MIVIIRPTTEADLPEVMAMYAIAGDFMRQHGNATQWVGGYPSASFIREEIGAGHSFICENEWGVPVGTFCFIAGDDPTYSRIDEGEWLNNEPYASVHRIASSAKEKGVAKASFEWCFQQCPNIRVDTHRDNRVMQRILEALEFTYCGIIYVSNGTERLAYQKKAISYKL